MPEGMSPIERWAIPLQIAAFWPALQWFAFRSYHGGMSAWSMASVVAAVVVLRTSHEGKRLEAWVPTFSLLGYLVLRPLVPPSASALYATLALGMSVSRIRTGRYLHPGLLGLFALALPLEDNLDFFAGYPLRSISTSWAVPLIELTGHHLVREGTTLLWSGETILVDVPCSGIRMLTGGMFCCALLICHLRLSLSRALLFSVFCLFLLIAGNALRVALLFFPEAGIARWPDVVHPLSGTVIFALALALSYQVAKLLAGNHPKGARSCDG